MIKHNLTKQNYFGKEAQSEYLGSSSFKAWDMHNKGTEAFGNFIAGGCEAREVAKLKGEWEDREKEVFLVGSYVHAWAEGRDAFNKFCSDNNSEIYQKNGKPYAAFAKADLMIETLRKSELVQKIMDSSQKELILVGEIGGEKFKVQIDIAGFDKGYFADIKTTESLNKTGWKDGVKTSFIGTYDYYLQFAIYAEIIRQNLGHPEGEWLEPYVIVVDKQVVPDHEVIYLGTSFIQEKLDEIILKLPRIVQARSGEVEPIRCGKCDYCKTTKVLEMPISVSEFEERLGLY